MAVVVYPTLVAQRNDMISRINGLGGPDYDFGAINDPRAVNDYRPYVVALLDMFEVTENRDYLDAAKTMLDSICDLRADRQSITDEVRSEIPTAWIFVYNSEDYAHIMYNGRVLIELARWCVLAKGVDAEAYATTITRYDAEIDAVLTWWEAEWITAANCYTWPQGIGQGPGGVDKELPFNGSLALGTPRALMVQIGYTKYLPRLLNLISYFEPEISIVNGAAQWRYWRYEPPDIGEADDHIEDLSHAYLGIDFIFNSYLAGAGFTWDNLNHVVNAFSVFTGDGWGVYQYMDGTGDVWPISNFGTGRRLWWYANIGRYSHIVGTMLYSNIEDLLVGQSNTRKFWNWAATALTTTQSPYSRSRIMQLTATLKVQISSTATKALDLTTSRDVLDINVTTTLSNGTGANQANQHWHDQRSLAAAASEELDLAGGLTDVFGDTVTFTRIKAMYIKNNGTASSLRVGGATATQFYPFVVDSSDILLIKPGGRVYIEAPDVNGMSVGAGTADTLKIAHGNEDSVALTYDIVLIGTV